MHIKFVGKGKSPEAMAHSWDECQTTSQEEDDLLDAGGSLAHGSSPFHEEDFERGDASPIQGLKRD